MLVANDTRQGLTFFLIPRLCNNRYYRESQPPNQNNNYDAASLKAF